MPDGLFFMLSFFAILFSIFLWVAVHDEGSILALALAVITTMTLVVFWSLFFPLLSIICGVVAILYLYLKLTGKILQDTSKLNLSTAEQLLINMIIICLLYIICYPIDKLRRWLFPKLFFLLGRQKKTMEKIESVRKVLFIVICIGLVVSILAGLLLRII